MKGGFSNNPAPRVSLIQVKLMPEPLHWLSDQSLRRI